MATRKALVTVAAFSSLLAGCGAADEYSLARKDVYVKLARIAIEPSRTAPWGMIDFDVHGNGLDMLTFGAEEDAVGFGCTVRLRALAPDKTKIAVDCKKQTGGDAASGMLHVMLRNNLIEVIDATLDGRPVDQTRASATAAGWPGDGVDGSIGGAVGKSLKMDADMRRDLKQMKENAAADAAEQAVSQPDSAEGADPSPPEQ